MPAKLGKHWWACSMACPRVFGGVHAVAGVRCGAGRARAQLLVQQQHEQQDVEQHPLMGFCRSMRLCSWVRGAWPRMRWEGIGEGSVYAWSGSRCRRALPAAAVEPQRWVEQGATPDILLPVEGFFFVQCTPSTRHVVTRQSVDCTPSLAN